MMEKLIIEVDITIVAILFVDIAIVFVMLRISMQ